jgi:hypothetical protein
MKRYKTIAKRSFKTKWNIYIFEKTSNKKESEIEYQDFNKFKLTDEIVKKYANEYWQWETDKIVGLRSITDTYKVIDEYTYNKGKLEIPKFEEKYVSEVFPTMMTESDFEKLIDISECYYCKTTTDTMNELGGQSKIRKKNFRGWKLEVERLKPNFEYSFDNCEMCCYWCNNAKTDEFSAEEFKAVGKEIGRIFNLRLNARN